MLLDLVGALNSCEVPASPVLLSRTVQPVWVSPHVGLSSTGTRETLRRLAPKGVGHLATKLL